MRIDQLTLLRYGRFTDRVLHFPAAAQDIHLVVGANEAGKSTLRRAIGELLYGIERNTPLNFLHPMPELRLDAVLSHAGQTLALQRLKKDKQSLRSADGSPLADGALAALLGGSDKPFFERMFGLDQQALAAGGLSLLSAKDDLGQQLFQSAAGLAGLGDVAHTLASQADSLWGPRKRGDRAYHAALADLEAADEALKTSTVRIKAWTQAQDALHTTSAAHEAVRRQLATARERRNQLERIRRVRPVLAELQQLQAALQALLASGAVPALPADAAQQLAQAHSTLRTCQAEAAQHQAGADAALAEMAQLPSDDPVLAAAADIDALDEARIRCAGHDEVLAEARDQLLALLAQAQALAEPLGWCTPADAAASAAGQGGPAAAAAHDGTPTGPGPAGPAAGSASSAATPALSDALARAAGWQRRLPAEPLRRRLDTLAQAHAVLAQACRSAQAAQAARQRELAHVRAQLAALPAAQDVPALTVALATAQRLGDAATVQARLSSQVRSAERALHGALQALGAWQQPVAALRAQRLPSADAVAAERAALREAALAERSLRQQVAQRADELAALQLALQQLAEQHQIVTAPQLAEARAHRNQLWQTLRRTPDALVQQAPAFEQAMLTTDQLADQRHDSASAASDLRARQQRLAQLQAEQARADQALAALQAAQAARQQAWAQALADAGVRPATLAPDALAGWADARGAALAADDALADAHRALQQHQAAVQQASQALALALGLPGAAKPLAATAAATVADTGAAEADPGAATAARADADADAAQTLALLIAQAEQRARLTSEVRGQAASLAQQVDSAERAGLAHQDDSARADAALAAWWADWCAALAAAGLSAQPGPGPSTPAEALSSDAALAAQARTVAAVTQRLQLMHQLDALLQRITTLQAERVHSLHSQLAQLQQQAQQLARGLDAGLLLRSPADAALALRARLFSARQQALERSRLRQAAADALARRDQALARAREASAALQPLRQRAGVVDDAALAEAITRAEQHQALQASLAQARQALAQAGDGLDEQALADEAEQVPPLLLLQELDTLTEAQADAEEQLSRLAAERESARAALAAIGGSDAAAQAEARRQDALARMTDAVERYVSLSTAARLMRWAIERYRETQQGPLLAAASRYFSGLTGGAFERLAVDFAHEPPLLEGRRPGQAGTGVPVAGMSEGTRDQLYLALRLAALDLHLDAGHALPFVADDLLVNWDDTRSIAGLQALGELSRKTQVIVLTHHQHLVDLARQALGPALHVLAL